MIDADFKNLLHKRISWPFLFIFKQKSTTDDKRLEKKKTGSWEELYDYTLEI